MFLILVETVLWPADDPHWAEQPAADHDGDGDRPGAAAGAEPVPTGVWPHPAPQPRDEKEVVVRNPCTFPIEFYSLEFDKQYLTEEKVRILKMLPPPKKKTIKNVIPFIPL